MRVIAKRPTTILCMLFSHDNKGRLIYSRAHCDRNNVKGVADSYMNSLSVGSVILFRCKYKQSIHMILRYLRDFGNIKFHFVNREKVLLVYLNNDSFAVDVTKVIIKDKLWLNQMSSSLFQAIIGKPHQN